MFPSHIICVLVTTFISLFATAKGNDILLLEDSNELGIKFVNLEKVQCASSVYQRPLSFFKPNTYNMTNVCEFALNYFDLIAGALTQHLQIPEAVLNGTSWYCHIAPESVCDEHSICLTDECECTNSSVFFCKDGSGCISFNKLCDGSHNCIDGSDESLCEGQVEIVCPDLQPHSLSLQPLKFCRNTDTSTLLMESFNCSLSPAAASLNCTDTLLTSESSAEEYNEMPLYKCLKRVHFDFLLHYNRSDAYIVSNYCKKNCSKDFSTDMWAKFCDHLYLGETSPLTFALDYVFNCEPKPFALEALHISVVCDGKKDCKDGADEIGCPGRFYCSPNSSNEWVSPDRLCDKVKDCSNGQDECGTCDMGSFSSSEYLIHSKIVIFSTGVAGLFMILLNSYVGLECYKSTPTSKVGKVDRLIRLQVCFYDGLMGIYNLSIVLAAIVLREKGDYCFFDQIWRSGIFCSILGVLFSVSSSGSLMAIALMSIVRCLICTRTIDNVRKSIIHFTSVTLLVMNLLNSVVPILPIASIQDIFRTQAFFTNFKDNPFISSGLVDVDRLNELHEKYFSSTTDLYNTVKNLNNITSKDGLFDMVEIGYYGNNRMCIHNIFKKQDSYLFYKLFYFTILLMVLAIVALTYLIILFKKIRSHRRLRNMGAAQDQERDDEISSMKVKIFLMIGTELLSWTSLMLVASYYQFLDDNPPDMTFEVFALVVIPVNSLLNPIFYSGLYSKFSKLSCRALRRFEETMERSHDSGAPRPSDIEMNPMNEIVPKDEQPGKRNVNDMKVQVTVNTCVRRHRRQTW